MNRNKRNRLFDYFQLQQHHSSWKKEFLAGGTTFFTVAYILVVNPAILSDAGIPHTFAFLATVFSTVIGSLLMGLYANAPLVLTPGMGVNAFFAYTLVLGLGLTWQQGLAAVVMAGVIFVIAAFSPLGHTLSASIPDSLKHGVTAGIGVFLTFIGLQKGMLVTAHPDTLVALGDFTEPQAMLSLFGLLLTLLVYSRGWKGSFLLGIAVTTLIAVLTGHGQEGGRHAAREEQRSWEEYTGIVRAVDFSGLLDIAFWVAALSLAIIVIFENMGVINGLLPDRTKFPRAFQANAISSLTCGFLGTSPTVASAESAVGVEEGGRTGLTAVVAAMLFLVSLVIYPLLHVVPDGAIAPVLIIVGGLMARNIRHVPFQHFADWFSAYLIMALIPLTSSIADGIAIGFIVYPLLKSAQKQHRDVPLILYVIAALFALHYVLLMLITH